jgi:hypothetical protein
VGASVGAGEAPAVAQADDESAVSGGVPDAGPSAGPAEAAAVAPAGAESAESAELGGVLDVGASAGAGEAAAVAPAGGESAESAEHAAGPHAALAAGLDDAAEDLELDRGELAAVGAAGSVESPADGAVEPADADPSVAGAATGTGGEAPDAPDASPAAPEAPAASAADDGVVIDLAAMERDAAASAALARVGDPVIFQPEHDPVDQILQSLIRRARERQVAIAEVAAELVEQAHLQDRDIDEVLTGLVGRVDAAGPVPGRTEELTLFNAAVPRRPGRIGGLDQLDNAEKKRVIIRVLCLLVAMQTDEEDAPDAPGVGDGPPTGAVDGPPERVSARETWPVPLGDPSEITGEHRLPDRRLLRGRRR